MYFVEYMKLCLLIELSFRVGKFVTNYIHTRYQDSLDFGLLQSYTQNDPSEAIWNVCIIVAHILNAHTQLFNFRLAYLEFNCHFSEAVRKKHANHRFNTRPLPQF